MQRFLQRIWQTIQRFWQQLLGGGVRASYPGRRGQSGETVAILSDTDYEFLFSQLLEGIAHGWHEGRILKFFEQLGERGRTKIWLSWLDRFSEKVLASPSPNLVLAARLMRLGELAQSFPRIEPIGQAAYQLAHQLYARQAPETTIWEYEGPEAGPPQLPTTPEGWLTLGLQQANAGDLGAAIHSWEQAILLDPNLAVAWHNRGSALGNLGQLEEALASFEQAVKLNPEDPGAWFHRGTVLEALEQGEAARACYEQVLALDPQIEAAQQRLQHLQALSGAVEEATTPKLEINEDVVGELEENADVLHEV